MKAIELSSHRMEPWFFSPYPIEFSKLDCVYLCDFCLRPHCSFFTLSKHSGRCTLNRPPGQEVYRKDKIAVFEVDGSQCTDYTENLSLLAKLFLDHKVVDLDTTPFLFYVMTEEREGGDYIIGYFSKEKLPAFEYNLACILVLPAFQRRGYGQLLIEFSYELSKIEKLTGTPERPFSGSGHASYQKYWRNTIIETVMKKVGSSSTLGPSGDVIDTKATITITELCKLTSISKEDIISTLKANSMLLNDGSFCIRLTSEMVDEFNRAQVKQQLRIDPTAIRFTVRDWRPKK